MKIAIIGAGNVGGALAGSIVRAGHDVTVSSRDLAKARTVAEAAKALGVKVYTIGVGKRGESRRPRMDRQGRYLADFLGRKIYDPDPEDLDEGVLQEIANMTNGKYYRADNSQRFQAIYAEIDKLEKTVAEVKKFAHHNELFAWMISPGLGLLLLEVLLRHTIWRRLP